MGIQRATGKYLVFMNADDALREDALFILVLIAKENDYTVISSNHYLVKDEIKVACNYPRTGEIDRAGSAEDLKRYHKFKESSFFGYAWGKLYKTSFIKNKNIKFSKEKDAFLEDKLFNLKVFSYNPKYYVLNEPLYYYSVFDDSLFNKKEDITDRALNMLENYEKFLIQKNKYTDNLDLFVPLTTQLISWSVLKALQNKFSLKTAFRTIRQFSQSVTMKRLLARKGNLKEIWKIRRPLEGVFYSLILILMKYKLEAVLVFLFVIGYPLKGVFINKNYNK